MYQNATKTNCNSCHVRQHCSFDALPSDAVDEISEIKRTISFTRGETVFGLGDEATHFYCVRSGRLQVYRSSPYREQSFKIATAGDWIGYRDALGGGAYHHGARCLSDATVCKIPASMLGEYMASHPEFARSLVSDLAEGWVESENQSYNLGSRKIMERLADYLLTLKSEMYPDAPEAGLDNSVPHEVDFSLTREMLATLLGTTTESVIRTLSDFKARGWIDLNRSKVTLTNEKELAKLVAES